MTNIIRSAKITAVAFIMCVVAFLFYIIELAFIDAEIAYMNPLISGFLHQGIDHLILNMLVLFIAMLNPVNAKYGWRFLFIITTIISLVYLPIAVLGITGAAMGLSGTCYFFLTRSLLTWGRISKIIFFILVISEAACLLESDGVAHGVHLIGIIMGLASLYMGYQQKSPTLPGFFQI